MRANAPLTAALGLAVLVGVATWFTWQPAQSLPNNPAAGSLSPDVDSSTIEAAKPVAVPGAVRTGSKPSLPQPVAAKIPGEYDAGPGFPKNTYTALCCPDGRFLPLLNGVPYAYPMNRVKEDGPLPPVVDIIKDSGGYEWYLHADGSSTTTRWTAMTKDGQSFDLVVTDHKVPLDGRGLERMADGGFDKTTGLPPKNPGNQIK